MNKITPSAFTRVNNDYYGNPRYVCHFSDLISLEEYQDTLINLSIDEKYTHVLKRVKPLGGKKYRCNNFGGGVVFQSYNLNELCNRINETFNLK